MTASPRGAVYSTFEVGLDKMGVSAGSVTLLPCESYERFCRTPLWEVVEQPQGWDKLSQHSMVCKALVLMTEWLWRHQKQTASILIFVAGESEVFRMRNAIVLSEELEKVTWTWEVHALWGNCPWNVESEVRDRLDEHDFSSRFRALFLLLTDGKGADGWTPKANAMINCSEQIDLDDLGFLNKGTSDKVSNKQREGRIGRVTDGLVLHLED